MLVYGKLGNLSYTRRGRMEGVPSDERTAYRLISSPFSNKKIPSPDKAVEDILQKRVNL